VQIYDAAFSGIQIADLPLDITKFGYHLLPGNQFFLLLLQDMPFLDFA